MILDGTADRWVRAAFGVENTEAFGLYSGTGPCFDIADVAAVWTTVLVDWPRSWWGGTRLT